MGFLEWIKRRRKSSILKMMTRDEVMKHNKVEDCWIVIDRVVYDVSRFLLVHPGGARVVMEYAGKDCTEAFNQAHAYINKDEVLFNEAVGFVTD